MRGPVLPFSGRGIAAACLALSIACGGSAAGAFAQDDDLVGLYFDEAYTVHEYHIAAAPEMVSAYLVLMNPSAAGGVAGWECQLSIQGPATLMGTEYAGEVVNILSPPQFMVGVSDPPLPGGDAVRLARLDLLVDGQEPVVLRLRPTYQPSLPGQMSYLDADGLTDVLPMTPATGRDISAWINVGSEPACAVSVESVDFPTLALGTGVTRQLTVANPGIVPLEITPTLLDGSGSFSVEAEGQTLTIDALAELELSIHFQPSAIGVLTAELQLAEPCSVVTLTGSGREPVIAWEMDTLLDFGEVVVGDVVSGRVYIRNTGEVTFNAVPRLPAECDAFRIQTTGTYVVPPGGSNVVTVIFSPTETGDFECVMDMGDVLPPVTVTGSARLPQTSWEAPELIDFGDVDHGLTATRPVVITNTGEAALYLDFELDPSCEAFGFNGPDVLYLPPGVTNTSYVTFTPQALGEATCQLDLGPVVPPVTLVGTSTLEVVDWEISPSELVLPLTPVGVVRTAVATISNTGNLPFAVACELGAGEPAFTIVGGGEPATIQPGGGHTVTVQFAPTQIREYSTTLSFGPDLDEIAVSGTGLPADDVCRIDPAAIDFGRVPALSSRQLNLTVSNLGEEPMTLTPMADAPELVVPAGPIEVAGGQQAVLQVSFEPQVPGDFEAGIDLGPDACGTVPCTAEVVEAMTPGADTIGLYYDTAFTQFESGGGGVQVINLYLALLECSAPSGVGAWECRVGSEGGENFFIGGTLVGPAVNVGTSPDFIVGVATPLLPNQYGTLLATMQWLTLDFDTVFFTLQPVSTPSIPGHMAWLVGGSDEIRPMYTPTGSPVVAVWNGGGLVSVDAPPPAAAASGSHVTISWERPDADFEACRVLRRQGAEVPLPVSGMIADSGGGMSFTDDVGGFAPGETLHYSYALYRDGAEIARSSEVAVTVPAAAALATQLLPNVPNPFNPQTEIRFQLERTGRARMVIFDVQGRKVRTLVDESLSSGPQSRFWYGKDDSGRQAPSGSYYVRLETDGEVDTRKILLLK